MVILSTALFFVIVVAYHSPVKQYDYLHGMYEGARDDAETWRLGIEMEAQRRVDLEKKIKALEERFKIVQDKSDDILQALQKGKR